MAEMRRETLINAIMSAVGGQYGLPSPEDARDLPITIVQDSPDDASPNYDATVCVMPINIGRAEAATNSNRDAMRQQAHAALQKIIKDVHAGGTFSGLADLVEYIGGGIEAEAGTMVFAEARFLVRYKHLRGQPDVAA